MNAFTIKFLAVIIMAMPGFKAYTQANQDRKVDLIILKTDREEEEEIKKIIIAETDRYMAQDIDGWAKCYLKTKKTALVQKFADGSTRVIKGFEKIRDTVQADFDTFEDFNFSVQQRSDWNISVKGNVAWVHFKELTTIDGKEHPAEEIRVLQKEGGQWKIAMVGSIY